MTATAPTSLRMRLRRAFALFDDIFMPMSSDSTRPLTIPLLLIVALTMIGLMLLGIFVFWEPPLRVFGGFVIAITIGLLMLNRWGHTQSAALILSVIITLMPALLALLHFATSNPNTRIAIWLMWIPPAHVVAVLLLPPRLASVVMGLTFISIFITGAIIPDPRNDMLVILILVSTADALLMVSAVMNERYNTRIAWQARDLAENEARFRMLLLASSELIVIHQDGVIIDVNPIVTDMLGYRPDDVIGQHLARYVDAEFEADVRAAYANNRSTPYETVLVTKTGVRRRVEVRGSTQLYQGSPVRVAVIRDITEQVHRQAQEFALAVEREKVKTLQKFISDISHDLRTPLAVINTSIYLVGKLAQQPDKQQHQLEVLREQSTNIQRMLQDLISMSRLDRADSSDYSFAWLNIAVTLREAVSDHQSLAMRKQQTLTCSVTDDLPEVLIDAEHFKRAIKHLILNGLSYSSEGGSVSVSAAHDQTHVLVRVQDNGVGIPAEAMPYIFDYFYRGDTARSGGGMGLGLTIAKKIVEAHNGTIEASSVVGKGSEFIIRLPARKPEGKR